MSTGHRNSRSRKEEAKVSGTSESQVCCVSDWNLAEHRFHLARLLLLLKSTRTQVIQIRATGLHGAYRDSWYSQCSAAPGSPFSWSCALSQHPPSSSPLPSAACHGTGMEDMACAGKKSCRKSIFLVFAPHLKNACRTSLLFQQWSYLRVCYTQAVNPLHWGGCVPRAPLCTHTHTERWTEYAGDGIFHGQRLACADVCNSAYQEAPSEEDTVRPLVCRTRAFSKTLVKQFWSQREKALPHIFI